MTPVRAMVLAAGLGTRLRPITEQIPKPLAPVIAKPLIEQAFANLAEAGISEVIVNTHHLRETMRRWLRDGPIFGHRVTVSEEKETLLGTGGGIKKAKWFLAKSDPFVVLNGDTLSRPDLRAALESHRVSGALATLVLREDPRAARYGMVSADESGRVVDIAGRAGAPGPRGGVFIGAHVVSPEIFDHMPSSDAFCIVNDVYVPLLRAGDERIRAIFTTRPFFDLGTVEDFAEAQFDLMREGLKDFPHLYSGLVQKKRHVYVAASVKISRSAAVVGPAAICAGVNIGENAQIGPNAVIGAGVTIGDGARVTRSIIWPGARVNTDETLANVVRMPTLDATIPRTREPLFNG
ncbi:MAG: NDP-sugar synthase [Deltaproteobacteria bacterium]|nr:NDP-sugar synthase [Deltaproteobacteria bacterium]